MRDSYSALLGWLSHAKCPPPARLLAPSSALPWRRSRAAPSAPSCPFFPGAAQAVVSPPCLGKVPRFLALHHPAMFLGWVPGPAWVSYVT